jgi:uncharacterized membrane protein
MKRHQKLLETAYKTFFGASSGALITAFIAAIITLIDKTVSFWYMFKLAAPELIIVGAFIAPFLAGQYKPNENPLVSAIFCAFAGYFIGSAFEFYLDLILALTGGAPLFQPYGGAIGIIIGATYGLLTRSSYSFER